MDNEIKNYDAAFEDLFIQFMVSNHELFVRCSGILKEDYFDDRKNKETIKLLISHSEAYSTMPAPEQIRALTGKEVTLITETAIKEDRWFLDEIELFCKYKALRAVILSSPELLEEGRFGETLAAVKAAVEIALVKDLGTDYYLNPKERLEAIREGKGLISTGWKTIDEKLYGGLNRGEITIFAGQSGVGKSLFLQNLAVNWAQAGMNVVYITLELNEKLSSMRVDAMHTGYETRDVMRNIDDVHMKIRASQMKSKGNLRIKQLPNGCTSNDIRAFVKEYEIHSGIKVACLLVDYLDLMMPMSKKISAENLFVKDKYITEELRNLAVELDMVTVSASQLNRGSYDEVAFDASHIAGGISKVNTADNLLGISTSASMKESGRYQIQFMKTRSSSGVGSRVDLAFNNKSLRISDLEEGDEPMLAASSKSVTEMLKRASVVKSAEKVNLATGEITADNDDDPLDRLQAAAAVRSLVKSM